MINLKYLTTHWQRANGAMFMKNLDNLALAYLYPRTAPRLFQTAFCPTLQIIALGDYGEILFNSVVPPWNIVYIPATWLILEVSPDADIWEDIPSIILHCIWERPSPREDAKRITPLPTTKLLADFLQDGETTMERIRRILEDSPNTGEMFK